MPWLLLFLLGSSICAAQDAPFVTIDAPDSALAGTGTVTVRLLVLNPSTQVQRFTMPEEIEARLIAPDRKERSVSLRLAAAGGEVSLAPGTFSRHDANLALPGDLAGRLVLDVAEPWRARAVLDIAPAEAVAEGETVEEPPLTASRTPERDRTPVSSLLQRSFADHFAPHEPVYYIYGREQPAAKFQFSFKYRLFGVAEDLIEALPALRGIHFGYTQRSLWDLEGDSSPFYDTSYIPELFYESAALADDSTSFITWLGFQAGVRHESNGRAGAESRSLNMAYLRPALAFGNVQGWRLLFAPTFFTYITRLQDNPDLRDYRGYLDLRLVFGRNEGVELALQARMGEDWEHVGVQADLTVPLRFETGDFAAYLLVQYYDGYGESFLRYRDETTSWRAGISFVR